MMKKLLTVFLLSILSVSIIIGGIATSTRSYSKTAVAPLATTKVYIEPQNGTANVGEQYTITVKIADVTNLYGFNIQIRWGTAVLKYNSHTTYVGQPGGVLNPPLWANIDEVDETSTFSVAGAAPGTTYWISYKCLGIAIPFNGTGIVFTMTFDVLREGECDIYFTKIELEEYGTSDPIPYVKEDGYFYQTGLDHVPVADFTFSPAPAVANKTTTFDASGSYDPDAGGGISLYIWNFKDGTIENTTSPTINHTFATIPFDAYYNVTLTVLDDQGGGSQSKLKHLRVLIVHPRPVAIFSVWPEDRIAVVDKVVNFNASESYDPDPGGNIVEYRWNFGDGNSTNTNGPLITHKFHTLNPSGYSVVLTVVDDSDGLVSNPTEPQVVIVVQRRDVEVVSVAASPAEVRQGEDVAIDVTVANKGEAPESFNITAYYNTTMTNWIKVDEESVSNFPEQTMPEWEFAYGTSLNSTVNHILKDLVGSGTALRDDTKVRVGTDTGYWTLNPGLLNTATSSPTLVSGTPLTTGGWIWEAGSSGPKKLNGEFAAGDWAFKFKLYATQAGVNATVWTRILKSDNPNTQAVGALITVIKDWTPIFTAVEITNTTAGQLTVPNYNGNVSVPSTIFNEEYLFFEFQLQVTANTAGSSTTNVVFQVGGTVNVRKSRIAGTLFSNRDTYTLSWNTEFASAGNHVVKIETSEVPHETNLTNNVEYSNAVQVTQLSIEVPPLDVSLDVGTIHFRGEIAEFYILVTSSGRRVDASLNASMLFNHIATELDPADIEHLNVGIYSINYQIPTDASTGTFALIVDASRLVPELNFTQTGSALRSFLVSPTFTYWNTVFAEWNVTLLEIEDNIAVISTSIGEIRANLTAINATLSGLIIGAKDEVLAEIDTALGPVITTLETINATVTTVQGDTATISSSLGDANTSIGALQSTITMGIAATSILSAIAAIVAVLVFLRIRKLGK